MFGEKMFSLKKIFSRLNNKCQKTYIQPLWIHGQKIYKDKTGVSVYLRRWEIENLFQCLKSRGFCFEETHLTKHERISKLMALLVIGFCWAHKVGEWKALKKPIYFKKFRNGSRRPQYSFFRYGLDLLRDVILKIYRKQKEFLDCINQLFAPPDAVISYKTEGVL